MKNILTIASIILIVSILGFIISRSVSSPFGVPETVFTASPQTVIKELQQLQRLETASFTIEKVIEAGSNGNVFQEILYGDHLLLIANGQVIAGFDFSELKEDSIQVSGTTLHLQLPAPKILVSSLDNEQTRVYDRRMGLLSKGNKDLETQARLQAERIITQAACEGMILDKASENGRQQLIALFTALGFTQVTIDIPTSTCQ
ncbi:MAG TPA: DUF4230 domain-containing protein [Vitreimonas sp.]|nr:DUF4230 domain-containing protein [Vitreimonas sp.]